MTCIDELNLPETIADEAQLEDLLSTPSQALCQELRAVDGDLMILGVGGKVGPTIAMMAKRAASEKRVIGVSRFSDPVVRERLETAGVECLACDLLQRDAVQRLPDVPNIIYMAGKKFGTAGSEPFTWAMNTVAPTYVGERFQRTRIVAFSTLCVYPFATVNGPGHDESVPPTPQGEYPNSCVGRERIFQYFSLRNACPGRLIRLNYAIDLRYGVLQDIALKVRAGEAIDLRTGIANVIWQGDANDWILRSLGHVTAPSKPLNIGLTEPVKVRAVATRFGEIFGREPVFAHSEAENAWHSDCREAARLFGAPHVDLETMIRWNADWLQRDMPRLNKPTHYEERGGVF
jgi:nucleoside-diphosphate-sugar epimerase